MTTVELIPASMFSCDECGRDNFVRHRRVEVESLEGTEILEEAREESRELMETLGFFVDGFFLQVPTEVTCSHCKAEFAVDLGER